jgi:hypothetical protein
MFSRKKIVSRLGLGVVQGIGTYIGYAIAGLVGGSVALGALAAWFVSLNPGRIEMTRYDALVITMQVAVITMALFCAAVLIYPRVADLWWRWFPKPSPHALVTLNTEPIEQHHSDRIGSPTVTTSPPTLHAGLYVCDMRLTFADLEKDRHSELTMRVFNGTGRVVEFSNLSGHVKFNAPNNTDPARMGILPTPALRPDTARTVAQLQEWFLILTQRVPAIEADKLLAMLAADVPILFDLSELKIEVFEKDYRKKVELLPIWSGVSYGRGYGFGRIISATANIRV